MSFWTTKIRTWRRELSSSPVWCSAEQKTSLIPGGTSFLMVSSPNLERKKVQNTRTVRTFAKLYVSSGTRYCYIMGWSKLAFIAVSVPSVLDCSRSFDRRPWLGDWLGWDGMGLGSAGCSPYHLKANRPLLREANPPLAILLKAVQTWAVIDVKFAVHYPALKTKVQRCPSSAFWKNNVWVTLWQVILFYLL